jgi:putative nucleotide binding protein
MSFQPQIKKYEEYAYVLDFSSRARSKVVHNREGFIVQALGEEYLTLLELLAFNNVQFVPEERVYIGKERRDKIVSVLGKLAYEDLTQNAKNELLSVIEILVINKEQKYVSYFNNLQPITPRLHALELIPGIGKTLTVQILDARERKPFESFLDIQNRVGLKDPAKQVAKRIYEELTGQTRINIFIRK